MHENVLDLSISLSLNAHWSPIGIKTVAQAVTFLCSLSHGEPPGYALDIEMDGEELVFANPVSWDQWVLLPIRENDLYIQTAHSKVRAPLVTVARHFDRMPFRRPRWSVGNVHERDKLICGYSGRKLARNRATVDHIVPRSRGGRDDWLNTVTCDKEINTFKANRTPEEAGLTLIRKPKAPPSLPVSATITECRHPSWAPFLIRK
jgi:5-methylcytosine-specific restriction endonuclease McrA